MFRLNPRRLLMLSGLVSLLGASACWAPMDLGITGDQRTVPCGPEGKGKQKQTYDANREQWRNQRYNHGGNKWAEIIECELPPATAGQPTLEERLTHPKANSSFDQVAEPDPIAIASLPSAVAAKKCYPDRDQDERGDALSQVWIPCDESFVLNGISFVPDQGDCDDHNADAWQWLLGFRDFDYDGFTTGALEQVCSGFWLPPEYRADQSLGPDCDDGTTSRNQLLPRYANPDGDERGSGVAIPSCVSFLEVPLGMSLVDGDCLEEDSSKWQFVNLFIDFDIDGATSGLEPGVCIGWEAPLGYKKIASETPDCDDHNAEFQFFGEGFLDADGDLFTEAIPRVMCRGEDVLPAGYFAQASSRPDCDDNNFDLNILRPLFEDSDGDRVGSGEQVELCVLPGIAPEGYSLENTDTAPDDPTAWRAVDVFVDLDGDGRTVGEQITVNIGEEIPPIYDEEQSAAPDCDDFNSTLYSPIQAFGDHDADGFTGDLEQVCSNELQVLPGPQYTLVQSEIPDCDDSNQRRTIHHLRYIDNDGDTVGSGEGAPACVAIDEVPSGMSLVGTDCLEGNPDAYVSVSGFIDSDRDGHTVPEETSDCTNNDIAVLYQRQESPMPDCNDRDPLSLGNVGTVYADEDGDNFTLSDEIYICLDRGVPPGRTLTRSQIPDCNDTNPFEGEEQQYYEDYDGDGIGDTNAPVPLCIDPNAVPGGLARTTGDCDPLDGTKWQYLNGVADQDEDLFTFGNVGPICSGQTLPQGYVNRTSQVSDCDDARADRTILRVRYNDADGDEIGAGDAINLCVAVDEVTRGTSISTGDCDPADPNGWVFADVVEDKDMDGLTVGEIQRICTTNPLPLGDRTGKSAIDDCFYRDPAVHTWLIGHPDFDGDSYTASSTRLCTDGSLPRGYHAEASVVIDCDDERPDRTEFRELYVDADGDLVGTSDIGSLCVGENEVPEGYSQISGDCAPADGTQWTWARGYVDNDNDQETVGDQVPVCIGLGYPEGYQPAASTEPDCDDNDSLKGNLQERYVDADLDTYGAGPAEHKCVRPDEVPQGYSLDDSDCDDSNAQMYKGLIGYADRDGDNARVGPERVCTSGTLPPRFSDQPSVTYDCDDSRADRAAVSVYYPDEDGDNDGREDGEEFCLPVGEIPEGYSATSTDCSPRNARVYGGAVELCDGLANNCLTPDAVDGSEDPAVGVVSPCGLNGRGTQTTECLEGRVARSCRDLDVCVDGASTTYSCGINGRGTQTDTCVQGQWQAGNCNDPDACGPEDVLLRMDFNELDGDVINHGTVSDNGRIYGATRVAGIENNGLHFDGDDRVLVSNGPTFGFGDSASFSLWVKMDSYEPGAGSSNTLLHLGEEEGQLGDYNYVLGFYQSKFWFIYLGADKSSAHRWQSTNSFSDTVAWHNIMMTYTYGQQTTLKLYYDGAPIEGSWVVGNGQEASYIPNGGQLTIGAYQERGEYFQTLSGKLDNISIKSCTLTEEEIQDIYLNQR